MEQHKLTSTFLRIRAGLGRCAARMLGDDDAVDDALQDAFFRLWQPAQGGIATAIACNVLEDGDLVRLVEKTIDIYGTVNILSGY